MYVGRRLARISGQLSTLVRTSVIGIMEGTFTRPMPIGEGKTIPPTGKAFKLTMSTVGHWKNGTMDAEYLFWDNRTFMKQIGLSQ